MGLKDGCQLLAIDKTHRVHHRVTVGHRRVMQSHNQREIQAQRFGKPLLLPVQLLWPEPTSGTTAGVAFEQHQSRPLTFSTAGAVLNARPNTDSSISESSWLPGSRPTGTLK